MAGSQPDQTSRFTRRNFLIGAGAAAAGLAVYSGEIGRHELEIVRRDIAIRNLPPAFHGYRIAQLSDIHIDEFTEPYFLERTVHRINDLAPDLVLLTGDFVTHGAFSFMASRHMPYRCAEILSTLTAPLRYAVLGNHDVAFDAPVVVHALTSYGTPVLINQHIPIDLKGDRLWICGLDDAGTSNPDLTMTIPEQPGAPVILMGHEPDYADDVVKHPSAPLIDLMLAGHSHGGQIRLPVVGALVLPPMGVKYVEGLFRFNQMQLYVNRGLGTVGLPFRLNCPPEVTLITLQPA
jgi:uncharacterized protein